MMNNNKCSVFESTGGGAKSYFVGTVGTGEAARFMKYEGFHIPVV